VRIAPGKEAEVWSVFEDIDGRPVAPAFVYGRNDLGGRVGMLAVSVSRISWQNVASLYNHNKQDLFRNFFDRATDGALDVCAPQTPSTWLTAAVSHDKRELLVMVNNLAGEPRADVTLAFSSRWRGAKMTRLEGEGKWVEIGTAATETRLPFVCEPLRSEFIRVTRL